MERQGCVQTQIRGQVLGWEAFQGHGPLVRSFVMFPLVLFLKFSVVGYLCIV